MKLRMKRGWCLLLSVCMLALFLPFSLAENVMGEEGNGRPGSETDASQNLTTFGLDSVNGTNGAKADPYDKDVYSENDVNVVNAIIDKNGLVAKKDDPENWTFVIWGSDTPKRIIELDVRLENLTGSLDVRGLTALEGLDCNENQLTGLELSGLTALRELKCNENQLTGLDVRGLPKLERLDCYINQLTSLELSGLTELMYLGCSYNQLKSLNLTGVPAAIQVNGDRNNLTQLTTPDGVTLTVGLTENGFARIESYGDSASGQAEIMAYPKTGYVFQGWDNGSTANPLYFQSNASSTITPKFIPRTDPDAVYHVGDLASFEGIITHHQLDGKKGIRLGYPDTYPVSWDDTVSTHKRVVMMSVSNLGLTGSLDVRGLTGLKRLSCNNNQLTGLELTGLTALEGLDCNDNQLTSLDVRGLTALEYLVCQNNQLTSLELGSLTNLISLSCYNNQLTELELSGLTGLKFLTCSDNQLTSLEVGSLTTLVNMYCHNNQLTSLKLSGLTNLISLSCYNNQLTELELSGLPALRELYCNNNQLSNLDVSGLTALKQLLCGTNQLTGLKLGSLTTLWNLDCSNNQLTSLDVSGLNLSDFVCHNNPLSSLKLLSGKSIELTVTGSSRPWLDSFSYSSGQPTGMYTAKPVPGYGAAWSNTIGCTDNGNGTLSFDFATNGGISAISANFVFGRTTPLIADPSTVEIIGDGVQPGGQVQVGSTFTFTANPIETSAPNDPFNDDIRYIPESWSVNPSGDFATGYTQRFSTADMALGDHTLTVTYRQEQFDGTHWQPIGNSIAKTFPFTLVEQATPPVTPPEGNTPGGSTPGGNASGTAANPGTGDSGYAWYILGLALAGGALILLARKKKTA